MVRTLREPRSLSSVTRNKRYRAVPAPDFSPGKRAFKPARTLYLATTGFSPGETNTTTLTFGRMPQSGLEPETGAVCRVMAAPWMELGARHQG